MTNSIPSFAFFLENFFTQRMIKQRQASPNTIASYRDAFCLLLRFIEKHRGKTPSRLELSDVDAPLVAEFLEWMETERKVSARTRNSRLMAIRSFFRYVALEAPTHSGQIQRVLAIPSQRQTKPLVTFFTRPEVEALLAAPDRSTWSGRRDHVYLLLALQTGMRLSEMTALQLQDMNLESGAHVRVIGKGRKERIIPITKQTVAVLKSWIKELADMGTNTLFPSIRGGRLGADGVQHMLKRYIKAAAQTCPGLNRKHVSPHSTRHTLAMSLLFAGVDRAMIALWLGHESVETTQMYLHANLQLKEEMLSKAALVEGKKGRYHPDDQLLAFLKGL
jgi:site-specific recombinase XerD